MPTASVRRHRVGAKIARSVVMIGVSAAALSSTVAHAQDPEAAVDSEENSRPRAASPGPDIIVTGSRIGRSGFDEPNPVTVIGSQQAEDLAQVSVGEILQTAPQNSNFVSPTNVGVGNFNVGAQLANLRGLNPYFGTRTLTLVDGRRFVPSTNGGAVDTALIPAIMLERTEVVTGGASAVYGTDAVAGVVNLILRKEMSGIKAQIGYGVTARGDGNDFNAALAGGFSFAGGRGNVVIGGEYQKAWEIGNCAEVRDWCGEYTALVVNPNFRGVNANGLPNRIIVDGATNTWTSTAGVFSSLALQFNSQGNALLPFNPGQYANLAVRTAGATVVGGDGDTRPYQNTVIRPPVERYSIYGRMGYELTPSIEAAIELSFGRRSAANSQVSFGASNHIIQPDNFYLREAGIVLARPTAFSRATTNFLNGINDTDNKTWRIALGLDGDLGNSWRWNAYYTRGVNDQSQAVMNNRVSTFFGYALDAVDDPQTPGLQPICRALLSANSAVRAAAEGCVPLNLFGQNNYDPAAIEYAYRTLFEDFRYTQDVIAGDLSGDLFEGIGAGPVSAAFGAEYRHEYGLVTHGDLDYYPFFAISYGNDYAGQLDVYEVYGEMSIPLLRDSPGARMLDVNLAARQTWNKTRDTIGGSSGAVDFITWRANAVYAPFDWLRFRATRSRDVRAAGFRELYRGQVATEASGATVSNPALGGAADPSTNVTGGFVGLQPEVAATLTAGFVVSPDGALDGLRFSLDWYEIDLGGAIGQIGTANIVQFCYDAGNFCERILGNGQSASPVGGIQFSDITQVDNSQTNLSRYITRGVDAEINYSLPIGATSRVNFRIIGSYLYDMIIDAGSGQAPINFAGQSGPIGPFGSFNTAPKFQANMFLTYTDDNLTAALSGRFIGKGTFNVNYIGPEDEGYEPSLPNTISDNRVPSRFYNGLTLTYRLPFPEQRGDFEIFGSVNNLFDIKPVKAPGGNGYPTNPVYFDTIGTSFRFGIRAEI